MLCDNNDLLLKLEVPLDIKLFLMLELTPFIFALWSELYMESMFFLVFMLLFILLVVLWMVLYYLDGLIYYPYEFFFNFYGEITLTIIGNYSNYFILLFTLALILPLNYNLYILDLLMCYYF